MKTEGFRFQNQAICNNGHAVLMCDISYKIFFFVKEIQSLLSFSLQSLDLLSIVHVCRFWDMSQHHTSAAHNFYRVGFLL